MSVPRGSRTGFGAPTEPRGAEVVQLENAAVAVDGRTLWSGVDLRIEAGEFVAILGPNGVGKSTLLQVVLGAKALSAGSVRVLGAPPGEHSDKIGYLPQRRSFDPSVRVRGVDVVQLGLTGTRYGVSVPLGRRARERRRLERARVWEAIELVGAHAYAERPIGQLSGGEQQRLLIAQALVSRPSLLLLDEPLESLDLPNQMAVADLVGEVCREQNVSVMMVAHDVNPILARLDRVVYIAGGRVVAGDPEQVITETTLSELYDTPVEVVRTRTGRLVVVGEPDVGHHHHGPHGEPVDHLHDYHHDEHHHHDHHLDHHGGGEPTTGEGGQLQ
jgi:zinc/manganese transport system ATP-binding protein